MTSRTGMRPGPRHRSPGFTLVELAVTVAILVGGIVGILAALSRVLAGATTAVTMTQAAMMAQTRLAELEVAAQTAPPPASETGTDDRFHWTTTVAPWGERTAWQTRTATVTWTVRRVARDAVLQQVAWVPTGEAGS